MNLTFNGAIHPAGFTATGQHDAETEQQAANYRVRPGPHDFGLHAELHIAKDTDGAGRHPEDDRFRHIGTPGHPHIAKGGGETDLRPFDEQAKSNAEQQGQTQFRLIGGGQ